MKQSFRRFLSVLLALAMLLSMAACAKPDGSDPTQTTVPTTGNTEPSATTEPTGSTGSLLPEEDYPDIPDGCNQLVIYWDYEGDLSTASFWIWYADQPGCGYAVEESAYGCRLVLDVPESWERIGFIARYNCSHPTGSSWGDSATKDVDSDRFIDMTQRRVVAYLKSGDPQIYYSNGGSLDVVKEIKSAGIASFNTIKYNLSPRVRITSLDQVKVYEGDRQIAITDLSSLNNEIAHGVITLAEKLDLSKNYRLEIEGYGSQKLIPTTVFDSDEFIQNYTYDGDDLGAVINGTSTTFKVWAPTASKVELNLYTDGHTDSLIKTVEMVKGEKGVWQHTEENCGHGTYYTYTVTTCNGTQQTTDPYAKAVGLNGNRSMVVDLDKTDPEGWGEDKAVTLGSYTDAVIWEVHVRDFSNKIENSQYKGKYLAFTERGLTNSAGNSVGVDYLLSLGITHIHLLPSYDFATVDESGAGDQFNWGYDPKNYNSPEGSYSTDPYNGEVRINEFKQMVQSLHADGLGVVMDVVYNHTYDGNSAFNKIVPYYYYRYDDKGNNTSASGCGNDTASERYMFRKFMVDSVSYWAEEYNLDGFRFDLMGLHDLETMRQIEAAVHAINPNAIIYGEGWTMGATIDGSAQANQSNISKIEASEGAAGSVSVFNDAIRDGLKGSVFEKTSQGYINGAFKMNETKVQFGIKGGVGGGTGWQTPGAAVINYMSAHDNNTLWDKLLLSNPNNTVEERMAMNRLGAAIMMISQGTPFWQAGEEMMRTKNGDENSYKSGDAVNNINWEVLAEGNNEYQMMLYYQGLIEMRQAYEIFRSTDSSIITFGTLTGGGMTVSFKDANGNEALVLINPTSAVGAYTIEGEWNLVADGTQAGSEVIRVDSGSVDVAARSVLIYVK